MDSVGRRIIRPKWLCLPGYLACKMLQKETIVNIHWARYSKSMPDKPLSAGGLVCNSLTPVLSFKTVLNLCHASSLTGQMMFPLRHSLLKIDWSNQYVTMFLFWSKIWPNDFTKVINLRYTDIEFIHSTIYTAPALNEVSLVRSGARKRHVCPERILIRSFCW